MAITLDTIVNKVFKVVKNGYDNNEVESFLDEILEEIDVYKRQDISRIAADEIADNLRNRIISLCGQRVIYAKQDRLRILRVFADGFKVLRSHFRIDHGIRPLP